VQARLVPLSRITSAVIAVATLDSIVDPASRAASIQIAPTRAPRSCRISAAGSSGPIGYVLRDVRALATPVPCRGYQAFWTLPADVAARVEEQLR
jgi:hypothetical protein